MTLFSAKPLCLNASQVTLVVKKPPVNAGNSGSIRVRKIPWRRKWQSTPVFLPGKSYGQRSLARYSPSDCKDSDTAEQLNHTHTHTHTIKHIWGICFKRPHFVYPFISSWASE